MQNKPLLIVIEGIDGSGKGTQAELLSLLLSAYNLHFPNYGTATGQLIARMLSGEAVLATAREHALGAHKEGPATALALQALMIANRLEIVPDVMRELTVHQRNVVLDRYHISGLVYGAYDELDPCWLQKVHSSLPKPDLCLLLDMPYEMSFERRPARQNMYEANRERMAYVAAAYRRLWGCPPHEASWRGESVVWEVIDATQGIEQAHADIWRAVGRTQELVNAAK